MQKFASKPDTLQSHLDCLYDSTLRRHSFKACTLGEFEHWQSTFRGDLNCILGIQNRELNVDSVKFIESIDRGSFLEERHFMHADQDIVIPLYLLIPKSNPPYNAVIGFHGHDPSVQWCLGNYPDEETRQKNLKADNNFAQVLVEAGFLVCVVEQRGMSNRLTDQQTKNNNSCRHLAFSYLLHGSTLLGERILEARAVLSWLYSRNDVVVKPGCTGHSAGGATALWLSALDERIGAAVISGYFSSFKGSLLAMEHCECNYIPGILALGEMGDLAALVAPRPLCLVNGEGDPIFPANHARNEFNTVQKAYMLANQPEAANLRIHPGGHIYNHKISIEWFRKWLPSISAIS